MAAQYPKNTKKQTRLQFTALSSSSPAKEKYSDAIQDRLTTVRHDFAGPSPARYNQKDVDDLPGLPTPERSSQLQQQCLKDGQFAELSCKIAQETKLLLEQTSSPLSSLASSARPVYSDTSHVKNENIETDSSSEVWSVSHGEGMGLDGAEALQSPHQADSNATERRNGHLPILGAEVTQALSEDENEDDMLIPALRVSTRSARKTLKTAQITKSHHSLDGSATGRTSLPGEEFLSSPTKRRRLLSRRGLQSKTDLTPRRSRRLRSDQDMPLGRSSSSTRSSFVAVAGPTPPSMLGSAETTGDEDDVIVTQPMSRRRQAKPARDAFVVDDDRIEYEPSSDEEVTSSKPKRRLTKRKEDDFLAEDDEIVYITSDDGPMTPSKSRKLSGQHTSARKSAARNEREKREIEDDLEDLQDSDTPAKAKKTRTRGAPVNKAREETKKHLEILKRRRAGEKIPRVEDSDDEDGGAGLEDPGQPTYSSTSESESVDSSASSTAPAANHLDDYEDDFIVDDSPSRLGLPHPEIPLEFTSYASRRPRELFVHIIDWLVKNKISPAFSRHDALFLLAFDKVGQEVKAQAGSRLISAAWNAPFRYTLEARPILRVERMPGMEEDYIQTCDACNRTNHPAQYEFRFSGKAYHHKTLEPVENSDSEAEEGANDTKDYDSKNHSIEPERRRFYLGRYCAANAEMGHKLSHWLFSLNQNVMDYLEQQGVLTPEMVVKRDKRNHKKREREAEEVVDSMKESGMVEQLWHDFKNDLDDARIGMDGFEKRGGRTRGRIGTVRVQREDGRFDDVQESRYRDAPRTADDSD